jgi:hypothetical protein
VFWLPYNPARCRCCENLGSFDAISLSGQLLMDLERAWFAGAHHRVRSAAAPDVEVRTAIRQLDGLVAAGAAIEVARRSKRRLFESLAATVLSARTRLRPWLAPIVAVEEDVVARPRPRCCSSP